MKKIFFGILFSVCFCSLAFAESLTLTTYYPAPFGMYKEMRVMGKLGVGTTAPVAKTEIVASGAEGALLVGTGTVTNLSSAFGTANTVSGTKSFASGASHSVTGDQSAAFGSANPVGGDNSFAAGINNDVSGDKSFASGESNLVPGAKSFAAGKSNTASGDHAFAAGEGVTAQAYDSFVFGRWNIIAGTSDAWVDADPLFVVGNGRDNAANRSNAVTVLKNGSVGINTSVPEYSMSYLEIFDDATNGANGMQITSGASSEDDPRIILKRRHGIPNNNNDGFSIAYDRSADSLDTSYVNANLTGNPLLTIKQAGNVGIGTTDPASRLDVGNGTITLGSGNISNAGDADRGIFIDSDGNIGLNKTDPDVLTHVGACSGGSCWAEDATIFKVDGRADTGHLVVGTYAVPRNAYVYGYIRPSWSSAPCDVDHIGAIRVAQYAAAGSNRCALEVCYPGQSKYWNGIAWTVVQPTSMSWKGTCHLIDGGAVVPYETTPAITD